MELVNYFLIPEIEFMLCKFFIAIDIHAYLKIGSISGAVNSIFDFIKAFESKLSISEKVTHLQNATYLCMVATFGKIYCPEYALKLVDADFNTFQYYDKNQYTFTIEGGEGDEKHTFEEEDRPIIKRDIKETSIEKLDT